MANTYTCLHYHLVFSTKNRLPLISTEIEASIWAYIGGIAKQNQLTPLQIGGIEDHIHVLVVAPATWSPSKIAQSLKGGSSAWIHKQFPSLASFAWQDGYGGFTVSKSGLEEVIDYIRKQREHHSRMTFQEEYLAILQKHGIEYDVRYIWS